MREDPYTQERGWGTDWMFPYQYSSARFDEPGFGMNAGNPPFLHAPGGTGGPGISQMPLGVGTQGFGFDFMDFGNQDTTSGFSLSGLGGIFGGDGNSNNGMGDLYNFLLALNSGKGGANGTNLFSGIEV